MPRRYRYRLGILDAKQYANDELVILDFNHGTEFHAQPSAVVDSNRGPGRGLWPLNARGGT